MSEARVSPLEAEPGGSYVSVESLTGEAGTSAPESTVAALYVKTKNYLAFVKHTVYSNKQNQTPVYNMVQHLSVMDEVLKSTLTHLET